MKSFLRIFLLVLSGIQCECIVLGPGLSESLLVPGYFSDKKNEKEIVQNIQTKNLNLVRDGRVTVNPLLRVCYQLIPNFGLCCKSVTLCTLFDDLTKKTSEFVSQSWERICYLCYIYCSIQRYK